MFLGALKFVWESLSIRTKIALAVILLGFLTPFAFKEWLLMTVRQEVHASIENAEKNLAKDIENLKTSHSETRADVRAIGIFLMGQEKLTKMSKEFAANDGTKK